MKTTATRAMLLLGIFYCVVGLVSGSLAGRAASHQALVAWRWAAHMTQFRLQALVVSR